MTCRYLWRIIYIICGQLYTLFADSNIHYFTKLCKTFVKYCSSVLVRLKKIAAEGKDPKTLWLHVKLDTKQINMY